MAGYVARRLLQSLGVLLGVSVIVFGLLHLTGDPTRLLLPLEAREEDVRQMRALLGLDDPLWVQYLRFLGNAVRGDFGLSFKHQVPALTLIVQTLPATLQLTAAGLGLALVVAVPAGILAALKRNSVLDAVCSVGVLLGQAMPVYWLGLLLIMVFAVGLGWFPAAGRDGIASIVLPATALGAFSMARIARMARSGMLEVLAQDYVRTARAAGIRAFLVTYKYALKNAAIPLVTIVGLEFGILLGGAVITETIFAWPGVGRLAVDAIFSRDYPLGTDHLGRDILSRLLYGGRISLGVGLTAVTLSALLGVTLGLLAGFFGGRADALIMRIVDVFLAIPYILLVMGVVFALGPSLLTVILVMGATRWVHFARVVRADVLSIREREIVARL